MCECLFIPLHLVKNEMIISLVNESLHIMCWDNQHTIANVLLTWHSIGANLLFQFQTT